MPNTFFVSDTHFGHDGVCKFLNYDGSKLRPFDTPEEMDEELVKRWNEVVAPNDKVNHLGDVVIAKKNLAILSRLNGHKRLIRGNHDIFSTKEYSKYFYEIWGVKVYDDFICSHIPLREDSITNRFRTNVHGHLHGNRIPDYRYLNVCVEQTDFRPISIDEVRRRIKQNREAYFYSWREEGEEVKLPY